MKKAPAKKTKTAGKTVAKAKPRKLPPLLKLLKTAPPDFAQNL